MDVLRRALPAVLSVLLLTPAAAQAESLHVVLPQSVEATLTSGPAGVSTTVNLSVQALGATPCDATTADVGIDLLYSLDAAGDIAASQPGPVPITIGAHRGDSDNCYIQNPVVVPLTVTIPAAMPPGDYTGVVTRGWGDDDEAADGPKLIVHVLPAPAAPPAQLPPPELAPPQIVVLGAREAPRPVLGKSVELTLVKGKVVYRPPGQAPVDLQGSVIAPNGTRVDATNGVVKVTVVRNKTGALDSADAWGTSFTVVQTVPGGRGLTTFTLADKGAGARNRKVASAASKKRHRGGGGGQSLWVNGKGNFQTKGKRASAIVMGTFWVTTESASGTKVKVERGVVGVRDFVKHRNVVLTKGQSYKATPRLARRVAAFTGSVRSRH